MNAISKPRLLRTVATTLLGSGFLSLSAVTHAGVIINFPDFTGACGGALTCVGSTADVGGALRVTSAGFGQSGAGYSPTPVQLGSGATFSTTFQFQFTGPGGIAPADGITFVLAQSSSGLGTGGGGIGYQGVPNSVAIEFDTFNNGEVGGSNHVGIDQNGVLANNGVSPYGVSACDFGAGFTQLGCMSNGDVWTTLIDYDATTQLLSVSVQDGANAVQNLVNTSIDLASILGTTQAFVGFTSGTGAGFENHDILNWRLANDRSLIDPNPIPEPLTVSLFGIGLVAMRVLRRNARSSV